MKSGVTYIEVKWSAAGPGQPVAYVDEIDAKRWSIRCIRMFEDATQQAFGNTSYNWQDLMPEAPFPPLAQINADPQFQARPIAKRQFEALWIQTYGLNQFSMMEPILAALPELRPRWDAFVKKWIDNPHNKSTGKLPLYLMLAELAGFLLERLEQSLTQEFAKIFGIIDRWLLQGDAYVKNAVSAGLLEDLQNPVRYQKQKPDDFKPWMQLETLKCWERLKCL
jgi:hypothetical protein